MKNRKYGFNVEVVSRTPSPNKVIYMGLHTCYSSELAEDMKIPSEEVCGNIVIEKLLKGNKGHYSPTELAYIVFRCESIPHSVMQQARTHRVGISFSVQSFRYCSEHLLKASADIDLIEDVLYFRPIGIYKDRNGCTFEYTSDKREEDISLGFHALKHYAKRVREGMTPEQARGLLPFDYRQHFTVGFNCRSLMHFLDLRSKKDAQQEIIVLSELIMSEFSEWNPKLANYYLENRWGKALLAP